MALKEFKAWLDGYKAACGDSPTKEQFRQILKKIEEIEDSGNTCRFTPCTKSCNLLTPPKRPYEITFKEESK